jgi:hypothetical protein
LALGAHDGDETEGDMLVFFSIHIVAQLVRSKQECGGEPLFFVIAFAIGLPLKLLLEVGHAETKQPWTPRGNATSFYHTER